MCHCIYDKTFLLNLLLWPEWKNKNLRLLSCVYVSDKKNLVYTFFLYSRGQVKPINDDVSFFFSYLLLFSFSFVTTQYFVVYHHLSCQIVNVLFVCVSSWTKTNNNNNCVVNKWRNEKYRWKFFFGGEMIDVLIKEIWYSPFSFDKIQCKEKLIFVVSLFCWLNRVIRLFLH